MSNLLKFLDKVSGFLDEGESADAVFQDFAKAFDKVPHRRLLKKLSSHGIDGKVWKWIEAWLTDRYQRVCIGGIKSSWIRVISGVPQGSVLSPVLFLIFINDLDEGLSSWILKFADDTKIFNKVSKPGDGGKLQSDLDRLMKWSVEWQMMFNVQKCKVMHFGSKNPCNEYIMNNLPLEKTHTERDLGVLISDDLKVSGQCSQADLKANRMLGLIKRTIVNKSPDIMVRLYKNSGQAARGVLHGGVVATLSER